MQFYCKMAIFLALIVFSGKIIYHVQYAMEELRGAIFCKQHY